MKMSRSLFDYLQEHGNDLSDHDLAVLADWANEKKNGVDNHDWRKPYALIREGADLLLRRRARSEVRPITARLGFQTKRPAPEEKRSASKY